MAAASTLVIVVQATTTNDTNGASGANNANDTSDAIVELVTNPIEADDNPDNESGYETEGLSSIYSTSITSSIRAHTFEDGYRYHSFHDGKYPFPNDENEQNRDDMRHEMCMLLTGRRLHFAPIGENPQHIIDLGTGTGIWAINMADNFPSATVVGIDLSPIQPSWVPPNLHFVVDDFEDEWVYPLNHFDFIHMKHTLPFIKHTNELLKRAFNHVKPGGWAEFQEIEYDCRSDDNSMPGDYAVQEFINHVGNGIEKLGSDLNSITKLLGKLEAAGFVNVKEVIIRSPLGPWPKDKVLKLAGMFRREAILDGLMNIAKRPLEKGLGWSKQEIEVLLAKTRQGLKDNSIHSYLPLHIVYGQKPLGNVEPTE